MKQEVKIRSIQYVHDPEAAQKWFQIWVDIVREELLRSVNRSITDEATTEAEHE
jgi:hypothetical protein